MKAFLVVFAFFVGWLSNIVVDAQVVLGPVFEWLRFGWLGPVAGA